MKTSVTLKYEGPALEAGLMDVRQASANMLAFSDFMEAAVKVTYGEKAEIKAQVNGFDKGSFETDLVLQITGSAATIFSALEPKHLWEIVREAFGLWKMLKGQPPSAIKNEGQYVNVTNNYGQILQVKAESFSLVMNEKGCEAAQRFVAAGLNHDGYASMQLQPENHRLPVISATKEEAEFFIPVTSTIQLSDNTVRMTVILSAAVFQEGNKWRFTDGVTSFSAAILDEAFLAEVDNGLRFGKGDVLEVEMRVIQLRQGAKISVERSIEKVLRHIKPHEQINLT